MLQNNDLIMAERLQKKFICINFRVSTKIKGLKDLRNKAITEEAIMV